MTRNEKHIEVTKLIGVNVESITIDSYLDLTKGLILEWYGDSTLTEVPQKFEQIQIQACVIAFSTRGAEGQLSHSENGISRSWKYPSVIEYIHSNITPLVRI